MNKKTEIYYSEENDVIVLASTPSTIPDCITVCSYDLLTGRLTVECFIGERKRCFYESYKYIGEL